MVGIYIIINKINNKIYIGQSINIEKRIKEHFWKAQNEKDISYNTAIHQAIRKHGKENFEWKVLEECNIEDIDKLEQEYIEKYNSLVPDGYNILIGGQKNRVTLNKCIICGKILKYYKSKYCVECGQKAQRKVERPTREELKDLIRTMPFTTIANEYGVSDKAITKWCIAENLPARKKRYKTIYR